MMPPLLSLVTRAVVADATSNDKVNRDYSRLECCCYGVCRYHVIVHHQNVRLFY